MSPARRACSTLNSGSVITPMSGLPVASRTMPWNVRCSRKRVPRVRLTFSRSTDVPELGDVLLLVAQRGKPGRRHLECLPGLEQVGDGDVGGARTSARG